MYLRVILGFRGIKRQISSFVPSIFMLLLCNEAVTQCVKISKKVPFNEIVLILFLFRDFSAPCSWTRYIYPIFLGLLKTFFESTCPPRKMKRPSPQWLKIIKKVSLWFSIELSNLSWPNEVRLDWCRKMRLFVNFFDHSGR